MLGLSTTAVLAQAPGGQQSQTVISGATAPKGNAHISGTVIDVDTKKPIEFTTVALVSLSTGKPVDGAMADGNGAFTISKVATGRYKLNISFLSYQLHTVDTISLTADNADVNIGMVSLASDSKKLDEVVGTGEKHWWKRRSTTWCTSPKKIGNGVG